MIQPLVDVTFLQRYFRPPFMVGSTLPNSLKPVNQTAECGLKGLTIGGVDAVLAASIFHFETLRVRGVKEYLRGRGVVVRSY
jgi:hypothetical protein